MSLFCFGTDMGHSWEYKNRDSRICKVCLLSQDREYWQYEVHEAPEFVKWKRIAGPLVTPIIPKVRVIKL